MSTVIKVNFKNGSWVAFREAPPAVPLRMVSPPPLPAAAAAQLIVPWDQNPYKNHDIVALMHEGMRFNNVLDANKGIVTAEICRWGIPLFEASAVKAQTDEFRHTAATAAFELHRVLQLLTTPPPRHA